jgi:uridine phosphorylase
MKQPHINCNSQDVQDLVIVCGDPARVMRIAALGSNPRHISTIVNLQFMKPPITII